MKLSNLTQQQKESIEYLGILELFEGCKKEFEEQDIGNFIIGNICGEIELCSKCRAKIQQAQKDFKREAEEVGEMIKWINKTVKLNCPIKINNSGEVYYWNDVLSIQLRDKIQQLKSKQDALILASELER